MTTKEKVLNLLKNYERLVLENHAFRIMLSTVNDARLRDTWEQTLEEVLVETNARAIVAAKFAPLYAQISADLDQTEALDLLLKMPVSGRPN